MASFARIDKALTTAVMDLHDHLWHAPRKDEAKLLRRLEAGAQDLDRFIGARGTIAGAVRPILRNFKRRPDGENVFEFLHAVANLAAAVEHRSRNPKEATRRASDVATSLGIGLSAASDNFDLVEEFEGGKTDFLEFMTRLADALEDRGVVRAGEFKRAANLAYDVHATWGDKRTAEYGAVASLAAIGAVAFAAAVHLEALRVLGRYREVPHAKLLPAVHRILKRLGAHA